MKRLVLAAVLAGALGAFAAPAASADTYSYTSRTFRCDGGNLNGHVSNSVTWHWSWWTGPYGFSTHTPGTIKNAWRETVQVPSITGKWDYMGSYENGTMEPFGGIGKNVYGMKLTSHFRYGITVTIAGITTTTYRHKYISNFPFLYAGGTASSNCAESAET